MNPLQSQTTVSNVAHNELSKISRSMIHRSSKIPTAFEVKFLGSKIKAQEI